LSTIAPKDWSIISNELAFESNRTLEEKVVKKIMDVTESFNSQEIFSAMQNPTVTIFKTTP